MQVRIYDSVSARFDYDSVLAVACSDLLSSRPLQIDAERAALTGLPEGVYVTTDRAAPAAASPADSPAPQSPRQSPAAAAAPALTLEEALAAQLGEPPDQLMEPSADDQKTDADQEPMEQDAAATAESPAGSEKEAPERTASPVEKTGAAAAGERERPPDGQKDAPPPPAAEAVGDVLDEFVGGLVDTADYAPLPPGGETAPAAAAADFDAGQIQIRLPDGRDLATAAAASESAETDPEREKEKEPEQEPEGEQATEAGASMPLLADQR